MVVESNIKMLIVFTVYARPDNRQAVSYVPPANLCNPTKLKNKLEEFQPSQLFLIAKLLQPLIS